jgi:hypothetical protein
MQDEDDEDADVPDSPFSPSPYSASPAPGMGAMSPPPPPDSATTIRSGSRMPPLSQHTRERVTSMGSAVSKRDDIQREKEKERILWSRWDKAGNR